MPCMDCKDEARCDRAGLCQEFAKRQLSGQACPECGGSGLEDTSGFGHYEACEECHGTGGTPRKEPAQ